MGKPRIKIIQIRKEWDFFFITAAVNSQTTEFLESLGAVVIKKLFNLNVLLVAIALAKR